MTVTFTESIRSFIEQGGDPNPETFDALWKNLKGALVREMMKRGLYSSPPAYLGYPEASSWHRSDALEELLTDCFIFAIGTRLERLEHHRKLRGNIDALVFINIRNFLFGEQKKYDPVGFRVFEMLHQVTLESIAARKLYIRAGNSRVRNDTVLGFSSDVDVEEASGVVLNQHVADWGNDLLPDLMVGRKQKRQAMLSRLRGHVEGLEDQGLEVFRFRSLILPLQIDIRRRWIAMSVPPWEVFVPKESREEAASLERLVQLVRLVRPATDVEDRDSYRRLLDCVDESLAKLEIKQKTKNYLLRLWTFLKSWAGEENDDKPPANQWLAEQLEIPRDRFRDLYPMLAELAEKCRISSFPQGSVIRQEGPSSAGVMSGGATTMSQISHKERSRTEMGKALSRLDEDRAADANLDSGSPRAGDIFLFPATKELPVEWVIVTQDAKDPGSFWVVPTDTQPFVGNADVAIPTRTGWGTMTVRCGYGVLLATEAFEPQLRIGRLEGDNLARVQAKRDQIIRNHLAPSEVEESEDADPDYEDWCEEVLGKARKALEGDLRDQDEEPPGKVLAFPSRQWGSLALAASILVALGLGLVSQQQKITDLQELLAAATYEDPLVGMPLAWFATISGTRSERRDITIPSSTNHVLFLVDVNDPEPFPSYRLEIGERDTDLYWSSKELTQVGVDELSVVLPRRRLPAGEYPFRIYGVREGQAEMVSEFILRVEIEEGEVK